ncbi:hypothetical protein NDU88_007414 [Pleurodeles waltl]|uniref:Uncharacterized protein n=1 Tax=Pleurodeles waltl TaxID=8319 RepID=A0AAV7VPQ1_PLEWA|nr:hypothetical protein NDU88_007414 [Pleurodeles waltl]
MWGPVGRPKFRIARRPRGRELPSGHSRVPPGPRGTPHHRSRVGRGHQSHMCARRLHSGCCGPRPGPQRNSRCAGPPFRGLPAPRALHEFLERHSLRLGRRRSATAGARPPHSEEVSL